ncbi:MAG: hypothetical protein HYS13_24770 [Planctomycetia bacterium]|nr:hypothetical protein [Planctomycetia bacterium]
MFRASLVLHELVLPSVRGRRSDEALQTRDAEGWDEAIAVGGKYLTVDDAEAWRLAEMGVEFAYLCNQELADGSFIVVTVPVK